MSPTITKLLVANRGEIAARDHAHRARAGHRHRRRLLRPGRRRALRPLRRRGGPAARRGARRTPTCAATCIIAAARATGADAVHPGYGFLSENAAFARACADAGLIFVGPAARRDRGHGRQDRGQGADGRGRRPGAARRDRRRRRRRHARRSGRRRSASRCWSRRRSAAAAAACAWSATRRSWPSAVARRAPRGGRRVRRRHRLPRAVRRRDPRHVEVQILGDAHGNVVHLFERECSIQRRYQKIVEEAPSPAVDDDAARRAGRRRGRRRARRSATPAPAPSSSCSTETGAFYFLEVNTRLQVEHPVTELVTGLDLVRAAAARRRGRAAAAEVPRRPADRARDRGPAVRRGRRRRLPARRPGRCTGSRSRPLPASGSTPAFTRRLDGQPVLRRDAGQGDRARRRPASEAAARLARALARDPGARRHHQPRPAGRRSCASPSSWPAAPTPATSTRHSPAELAARRRRGTAGARRSPPRSPGRPRAAPPRRCWPPCPSGWRNVVGEPQRQLRRL